VLSIWVQACPEGLPTGESPGITNQDAAVGAWSLEAQLELGLLQQLPLPVTALYLLGCSCVLCCEKCCAVLAGLCCAVLCCSCGRRDNSRHL